MPESEALGTPEPFCDGHTLYRHADHLLIRFARPCRVLSSAIVNGGFATATAFLNMRVPENKSSSVGVHDDPVVSVARYAQALGIGETVGMMTGAHMNSIQVVSETHDGVTIAAALTSGISNARRAGDRADYCEWSTSELPAGTINIALVTTANLTPAALAESLMIVTEAKAAVLQDANVRSPISGLVATGTGTDATAIVSGDGPEVRYCGKHTRFAQIAARCVAEALTASIQWSLRKTVQWI